MSRRRRTATPQAGKHRKRPREWHHGRAQGRVNESKIKRALPAFERAEADELEGRERAARHRADTHDWRALLEQLDRAAPALLAPFADL